MQLDALRELFCTSRERGLTGQEHGRFSRRHRGFDTGLGEATQSMPCLNVCDSETAWRSHSQKELQRPSAPPVLPALF